LKTRIYEAEAASFSKASLFIFIGTFLYQIFFTTAQPSLVAGVVFFFIGLFVVSILIAAPLMYIRKRYEIGLLTDIVLMVSVIYLTSSLFQYLFA